MGTDIRFAELRQMLQELGFREFADPKQIVFRHEPSDTVFVFRAYRPRERVADYNLMEVKDMLDARELMSAESFENQFRKTPA